MENKLIKCGKLSISNSSPFTLIAGPCQLENEKHALDIASKLKEITQKLNIGLIYKTSFDKANRTSIKGKRGAGLEKSLPVFDKIRKDLEIPVLTDVHTIEQCEIVSEHVDVLQIPAFLCRQTDLLIAAAKTGKVINVKKGQFLAPWDMVNVTKKIEDSGNKNILVTERGASFGYNTLVSDMRSIPIMAKNGYPVVFDATHSVQQPGGQGDKSGGQREFVEHLSRAAVAVGVAGIFTRATDANVNAEVSGGMFTFVEAGSANADNAYVLTSITGTATLGSSTLTFTQFSGAGQVTAGNGLDKSGNTLAVNVDDQTLSIASDTLQLKGIADTANGDILYGAGGSSGGYSALSIGTYDSTNSVGQLLQVGASSTVTWSNTLDGGTF